MKLKEVLEDKLLDALLKKDRHAFVNRLKEDFKGSIIEETGDVNSPGYSVKIKFEDNVPIKELIKRMTPYAKTLCVGLLGSQLKQNNPAYYQRLYDKILQSRGETEINLKELEKYLPEIGWMKKAKKIYNIMK
jgi:hypothetical protein